MIRPRISARSCIGVWITKSSDMPTWEQTSRPDPVGNWVHLPPENGFICNE